MNDMLSWIIILLSFAFSITSIILHFMDGCKTSSDTPANASTGMPVASSVPIRMNECSTNSNWAHCMSEDDSKKCLSLIEGKKDSDREKGCWVSSKKEDPCNLLVEGGVSPLGVPKSCADTCCSGGYNM